MKWRRVLDPITIEVSPSGTFSGAANVAQGFGAGSKVNIIGTIKSEGTRVWIEIEGDLIERKLRAKQEQGGV